MIKKIILIALSIFLLAACDGLLKSSGIEVSIIDGQSSNGIKIPANSTVEDALKAANITLNSLDKVDPSLSTLITTPTTINIVRVTEEYEVEDNILPFEHQTVKNESLQEGQSVLIQSGVNGRMQSIYRIVYENGVRASRSFVSSETLLASQPEIVMIGVQSPYSVQTITGMIAYISSGNAWVMETNTGNRRPVVTSGDLDGRIFSLSADRSWLLYSTSNGKDTDKEINRLWIADLLAKESTPIDTGIINVVHSAEWVPGKIRTISYSTADTSASPPFWNANNDLIEVRFDTVSKIIDKKTVVDTNSGGLYGWWGTLYKWSPDGSRLIYSRPDSIGFVDLANGTLDPIFQLTPYQTDSVWAWVPELSWSQDGSTIYATLPDDSSTDPSLSTNLTAILVNTRLVIPLVQDCGLFCTVSPSGLSSSGNDYVAFLSAILPDQSEISKYNLFIMDKDGSNQMKLYPGEGIQGLQAQMPFWEPNDSTSTQPRLAFIAQGNLMLGEIKSGLIKQITGDGSIVKIDWK